MTRPQAHLFHLTPDGACRLALIPTQAPAGEGHPRGEFYATMTRLRPTQEDIAALLANSNIRRKAARNYMTLAQRAVLVSNIMRTSYGPIPGLYGLLHGMHKAVLGGYDALLDCLDENARNRILGMASAIDEQLFRVFEVDDPPPSNLVPLIAHANALVNRYREILGHRGNDHDTWLSDNGLDCNVMMKLNAKASAELFMNTYNHLRKDIESRAAGEPACSTSEAQAPNGSPTAEQL